MDILQRIDSLRIQRNWTFYKLAEESGLASSTLFNMFSRKSNPSIQTLTMLCDAFGISLYEFFNETDISAQDEEIAFLSKYRLLSSESKNAVRIIIENLSQ